LDFPEEGIPYRNDEKLLDSISMLRLSLEDLSDRCSAGLLLREGIRVALTGRPNVGKSSLLNALLKQARAIVTALPGTTRDVIEEVITYRGIPIRLVDTAGLRTPSDEIEASGIDRTLAELRRADICLWVLDGSVPLDDEDRAYIESLRDRDHIVVLNKSDLNSSGCSHTAEDDIRAMSLRSSAAQSPVLSLSAKTGEGLDLLKDSIVHFASSSGTLDAGLNVTARQLTEVRDALLALTEAETAAVEKVGKDVVASLLSTARECLERLLGLSYDDALLESIFSRFCVGK
jgi:tRNA modification GTPase